MAIWESRSAQQNDASVTGKSHAATDFQTLWFLEPDINIAQACD